MRATNRLHELRRKRRLTQGALAEALPGEVSRSTINRLENGKLPLTWDYMVDIAQVLECDPWDLVGADAIQVAPMERALITLFRAMDPFSRESLMHMARVFARDRDRDR